MNFKASSSQTILQRHDPFLLVGVQCNGWSIHVPSDVTGELGKMVILPCTFTHPYKTFDRALTAIWRIREPYNGTIVFKCVSQSSSELCKTAISHKNKYKLLGNPRHKDLSIRIDNLTWSDSERYFCRVELAGDIHDKYESRNGIKLHVIGKRVRETKEAKPPSREEPQDVGNDKRQQFA